MGRSVETEVIFGKLDRSDLKWRHPYEQEDDWSWSPITHRAAKKLRDCAEGDIIEVVWSYDSPLYDIVEARRITGSPEEKISVLEARVKTLEDTVASLLRKWSEVR